MQNWEEGLRGLYKATPSKNIQTSIIDIMRSSESDRSVALVAAGLADATLMLTIIVRLAMKTPEEIDKLFWIKQATVPTFSRRIDKARSLKLIGPITLTNLNIIREVRNVFAHCMIDIDFDRPEIAAACNELVLDAKRKFFVDKAEKQQNRYRYCYACDAVFSGILEWYGRAYAFALPLFPTALP